MERAAKQQFAQVQTQPVQAAVQAEVQAAAPLQAGQHRAAPAEDPSRFCPVCSQPLESRQCKLTCTLCGYYMSCSDYY